MSCGSSDDILVWNGRVGSASRRVEPPAPQPPADERESEDERKEAPSGFEPLYEALQASA
jgi:hypothetical protein